MILLTILSPILLILTILDITSTHRALQLGAREIMWLPRLLIEHTGFRGLTVFKVLLVAAFCVLCFHYYLTHPSWSMVCLVVADLYTLCVVIHNTRIVRRLYRRQALKRRV